VDASHPWVVLKIRQRCGLLIAGKSIAGFRRDNRKDRSIKVTEFFNGIGEFIGECNFDTGKSLLSKKKEIAGHPAEQ